jgi:uncharacterized membrane protein YgcG
MIRLRQALDRRRVRFTFVIRILALMLLIVYSIGSAEAQNANPTGKNQASSVDPNSNKMSAWQTRENYFKRYPFAQNAYDKDTKSIHHRGTVQNAGNNSFLDGLFGGGETDFTDLFGGTTTTGNSNEERLQQSDPPAAGSSVTAYPFYIKFCNDNPYQGVCYWQFGEAVDTPAAARDMELFENVLTTFGYPVSDTQFQIIQRENFQRLLELLYDPERNTWMMTNTAQMAGASASNSLAGAAEQSWNTCIDYIMNGADGSGAMINVANERAATPIGNPNVLYKSVSEAVYMVQRMYREVFVPMAILFLLPGAVITQIKSTVRAGFNIEQTPNPFEGILRSIVAVFLIPATQVIVSYSIDVGNSMSDSVKEWVDPDLVMEWSHELTYNVSPENHKNVLSPPEAQATGPGAATMGGANPGGANGGNGGGNNGGGTGGTGVGGVINGIGAAISGAINAAIGGLFGSVGAWFGQLFGPLMAPFISAFNGMFGSGGDGIAANIPEQYTKHEDQLALSQVFQAMVNGTVFFVSLTIIMLTAFQIVFMCYLYLLGPLSAAMFAWPIVSSTGYFRQVFSKWVEAVICLALWRFYWTVALAIMTQRLVYIGSGKFGTGDLQWEAIIFCCSLGLMLWAAMNPFIYDPARAAGGIEQTVQTGKSIGQSGGGGGGGGGGGADGGDQSGGGGAGAAPQQGGDSQPQQQAPAPPQVTSSAMGSGGDGSIDSNVSVSQSGGGSGGGSAGPDGDDGSSSRGSSGDSGSKGLDSANANPDSSPPPSSSVDGGGGGAGDSGDSDGRAGAVAAAGPPSASADSGADSGGGGGNDSGCSDAATSATGLPAEAMSSSACPVPLGPSDSGTARYNSGADASQISAAASAAGGGGGGSGFSPAGGGSLDLSVNVAGSGDDGGGPAPTQAPPPPPPPPSSGDDE